MSGMGPAMDAVVAVAAPMRAAEVVATPAVAPARAPAADAAATSASTTAALPTNTVTTAETDAATTKTVVTAAPAPPARSVNFPLRPATTAAHVAQPAGHAPGADAGSIGGAVFSLLLVVGLILGLGWLAKRMPGMQRGNSTAQLKVVASVALGPRDRAVVLDVGGQQLLLGVGAGGVRTLHTLEHPLPVVESTATSPFAQVLAQHFGRKS